MLLTNRHAYTLSQFILLWILGVLFVILVFLTVLRYRATSQAQEAEAFMQEVRAEQEDRCALGRKYAVYSKHLKVFYKRKETAKFLRYDLSSGQGITVHHKLWDYHLRMPSYADGRICCDDCEKLNRYYSPCAVLEKMKDFVLPEPDCTVYPAQGKEGKKTADQKKAAPLSAQEDVKQPTEKSMLPVQEETPAPPVLETQALTVTQPQPQEDVAPAAEEKTETGPAPLPTEESNPASQAQTDASSQLAADTATPEQPTVKKCKMPKTGDFFIDECEVYQPGVRGSIVHTWNVDTCSYDVIQSCVAPAKWKRNVETKEEKGLYPSDLDDYCPQLLKDSPCPQGAAAGRECASADAVCYKDCRIVEQTEVKETDLIVLYNVQINVEQLRCIPAKDVTVTIQ